ncbi:small-subunit processome [Amylocystis lapponica]|nr:small-subunit processome [Amylocystis lapponica]
MSSLRNSLHRRNHKERSQLAHRSRLGILEKHKDYVLRARDYHAKRDKITRLRQKAAERNKDEFYFGMTREKTRYAGGVHVQDRGNSALPVDIVKVLKTQDENYLRTMRTAGLKKIDRLKNQLSALADLLKPGSLEGDGEGEKELDKADVEVLREAGVISAPSSSHSRRKSGGGRKAKHFIFAETVEEARQYATTSVHASVSPSDGTNMDISVEEEVDLGWRTPADTRQEKKRRLKDKTDIRSAQKLPISVGLCVRRMTKYHQEHRTRLLKELSARLTRDKQLRYAERELEMQRLLMGKGAARKLSGVEKLGGDDEDDSDEDAARRPKKVDEKTWKPRVYKWRVERKK